MYRFESLSSHRSETKTTPKGVVFVFPNTLRTLCCSGTPENRDFYTGHSCLPAILLRNRSPTDRAASSGNAGRKATLRQNRNSPKRRPRRNTGTSKAEAPLRTDTGILHPHRPQTPYPHRYAPNKESSPPVKTINRYLRPQSFRPLPDRPFPAKKYIPPIPTHRMDTRPVDRPPPTLRIKIYNRNTKTNNLFHIRHPAAGIIYSYLYPVNYTQTKKNDDRKTTSHLRYRYRTVPLRTRRRSRPERGRPDGRRPS